MLSKIFRGSFICLVMVCFVCLGTLTLANHHEDENVVRATGFYIHGGLAGNNIEGDFSGMFAIQSFIDGSVELLPDFDDGVGFQVGLGWNRGVTDFEISYERTEHDGTFAPTTHDGTYDSVNFDLRFGPKKRFRPFALVGFGYATLEVENGSESILTPDIADAEFQMDLYGRLGGGITYSLSRKLAFTAQGLYRFQDVDQVKGLEGTKDVTDTNSDGFSFGATLRYHFGN